MLTTAVAGFLASAALIVVIGAQNAFVLRQGITRRHVAVVVAICVASDLVLISLGVMGFGALVSRWPMIETVARYGGAAFLIAYAALALRRAIRGGRLVARDRPEASARSVALTCLAFTWLNPHVYLDSIVLLGGIATAYDASVRWWFVVGAGLASLLWFVALGYGARLLAPIFARPAAWRVLDGSIAVIMTGLAVSLIIV